MPMDKRGSAHCAFLHEPVFMINVLLILLFGNVIFLVHAFAEGTPEDTYSNKIDSYVRYMSSASAKGVAGKVEMAQFETEYGYNFKVFGRLPIELLLDTEYIGINNSAAVKLPAKLTRINMGIGTTLPLLDLKNTYLNIELVPSFCGDNWDFDASNFRMPLRSLMMHALNEKLVILAGIDAFPHFKNKISPAGGIIYKPNDKLLFNLTTDNPAVSYAVNNRITLFLNGDINIEEFEVGRGDAGRTILRYSETHAGTGISFRLTKFMRAYFTLGGIFNRSLKYRGLGGKVSLGDSLYTECKLMSRF